MMPGHGNPGFRRSHGSVQGRGGGRRQQTRPSRLCRVCWGQGGKGWTLQVEEPVCSAEVTIKSTNSSLLFILLVVCMLISLKRLQAHEAAILCLLLQFSNTDNCHFDYESNPYARRRSREYTGLYTRKLNHQ